MLLFLKTFANLVVYAFELSLYTWVSSLPRACTDLVQRTRWEFCVNSQSEVESLQISPDICKVNAKVFSALFSKHDKIITKNTNSKACNSYQCS